MLTLDESKIKNLISAAVEPALVEIGKAETDAIKSDLSVPVEYAMSGGRFVYGGGQPLVIKRSLPGEPPRMETGKLRENVSFAIENNGNGPTLQIVSSRPDPSKTPRVPQILENDLNRPYMSTALERLRGYLLNVFADNMRRRL